MPGGYPWLGRAGALVQLPSPMPGYEAVDLLRGGTHELAAGGNVRDRVGVRRRFVLNWNALTDVSYTTLRTLVRVPGPYRYLDPLELNLLTANQSTGTDELRDATGMVARFQGVCTSDTTFARSGLRSLKFDSLTALAATGRGPYWYTSSSVVDATWAAVRPSVAHTFSVWAHASVAVDYRALIDWYSAAGAYLSTDFGSNTAVSTSAWTQLVCANKTSPSTAAYGIGAATNNSTTGAATQVWFDDAILNEGATAEAWKLGAGTPMVVVDSFTNSVALADPAAGLVYRECELVLVEL